MEIQDSRAKTTFAVLFFTYKETIDSIAAGKEKKKMNSK